MWSRVSRAPPIHKHPFSHPLLQEQTSDLTTHPRPFPYGGIIIFFAPRLTCALSGSTKVLSWDAFKENGERKATLLWGCSKNCNPAAMAAMLPSLRRKLICNKNEAEREPEAKDRGGTWPRGPTPPKQLSLISCKLGTVSVPTQSLVMLRGDPGPGTEDGSRATTGPHTPLQARWVRGLGKPRACLGPPGCAHGAPVSCGTYSALS